MPSPDLGDDCPVASIAHAHPEGQGRASWCPLRVLCSTLTGLWWEPGDGTEPLWSSVFWSLKWGGNRCFAHLAHRKCFISCRAVHLTVTSQTLHQGPATPLVILLCRLCPVGHRCRKRSAQLRELTGSCLLAKHLLLTSKVCETLLP